MSDIDKAAVPTKLLWVDLEMTGLDPMGDVILEVAAEITDFNFTRLASYQAIVQQPADVVADRMTKNEWWQKFPDNRDEFIRKTSDPTVSKPSYVIENELIALVTQHFVEEPAVLAGNSIYNDRKFIARWWPKLDMHLHYRMLDVSAWKVFMQGHYGVNLEKGEVHRAFDDIQGSMAELQYYLKWFAAQQEAPQQSALQNQSITR